MGVCGSDWFAEGVDTVWIAGGDEDDMDGTVGAVVSRRIFVFISAEIALCPFEVREHIFVTP